MTPERWQQVKEIFDSALQLEPAERARFVAGACGADEGLRKEVESILASHEKDGSFIDSPAYEAAAGMLANEHDLKPGQKLAHYPGTKFLVYTRRSDDQGAWASDLAKRFPQLKGRVSTMSVPGGAEHATFRDPETAKTLKKRKYNQY